MTHAGASHHVIYCKIDGVVMPYDVSSDRSDYYDKRYFDLLGFGDLCESSGKLYIALDTNQPIQTYFFKRRTHA